MKTSLVLFALLGVAIADKGHGGGVPATGYGPPPAASYGPPPAPSYGPPPAPSYGPPPAPSYGPPPAPAPSYGPPPASYGPPPVHYGPPPVHYGPPPSKGKGGGKGKGGLDLGIAKGFNDFMKAKDSAMKGAVKGMSDMFSKGKDALSKGMDYMSGGLKKGMDYMSGGFKSLFKSMQDTFSKGKGGGGKGKGGGYPAPVYGPPPSYGPPPASYGPPPASYGPPPASYGPPPASYGPPPVPVPVPAPTYGAPAVSDSYGAPKPEDIVLLPDTGYGAPSVHAHSAGVSVGHGHGGVGDVHAHALSNDISKGHAHAGGAAKGHALPVVPLPIEAPTSSYGVPIESHHVDLPSSSYGAPIPLPVPQVPVPVPQVPVPASSYGTPDHGHAVPVPAPSSSYGAPHAKGVHIQPASIGNPKPQLQNERPRPIPVPVLVPVAPMSLIFPRPPSNVYRAPRPQKGYGRPGGSGAYVSSSSFTGWLSSDSLHASDSTTVQPLGHSHDYLPQPQEEETLSVAHHGGSGLNPPSYSSSSTSIQNPSGFYFTTVINPPEAIPPLATTVSPAKHVPCILPSDIRITSGSSVICDPPTPNPNNYYPVLPNANDESAPADISVLEFITGEGDNVGGDGLLYSDNSDSVEISEEIRDPRTYTSFVVANYDSDILPVQNIQNSLSSYSEPLDLTFIDQDDTHENFLGESDWRVSDFKFSDFEPVRPHSILTAELPVTHFDPTQNSPNKKAGVLTKPTESDLFQSVVLDTDSQDHLGPPLFRQTLSVKRHTPRGLKSLALTHNNTPLSESAQTLLNADDINRLNNKTNFSAFLVPSTENHEQLLTGATALTLTKQKPDEEIQPEETTATDSVEKPNSSTKFSPKLESFPNPNSPSEPVPNVPSSSFISGSFANTISSPLVNTKSSSSSQSFPLSHPLEGPLVSSASLRNSSYAFI